MHTSRRSHLLADVHARRGGVVLTASPHQAQAVASTLAKRSPAPTETAMDGWLDEVVHALAVTAAELDEPRVSRGDFLRGGWATSEQGPRHVPATGSPVALAVTLAAESRRRNRAPGKVEGASAAMIAREAAATAAEAATSAQRVARDMRAVITGLTAAVEAGTAAQVESEIRVGSSVLAAEIAAAAMESTTLAAGDPMGSDADAATAVAAAEKTALAAVAVASAVAAAAAQAAATASAATDAFEVALANAAAAIQTVGTATTRRVSLDTDTLATEVARATPAQVAAMLNRIGYDDHGFDEGPADGPVPQRVKGRDEIAFVAPVFVESTNA